MKVLITTGIFPPDIGGPATYSALLLRELPARGIGAEVLSFGHVRRFPKGMRHLVFFFRTLSAAGGADIVYARDPVSVGLPSFCAAACLRKKSVLKVVGDYAWEQAEARFGVRESLETFSKRKSGYGIRVRFLKVTERFVARHADFVIVPSNYLKGIVENWGVPSEKIKVIYNAFENAPREGNRDTIRKILRFEGMLLISVGRLVPWKGFSAIIRLMPRIAKAYPGAKLLIVGDGPERKSLEHLVAKLRLSEKRVVFTGKLSQDTLHQYIRAADVFILNTAYEGFSHLLLEVMALGTPIISTDAGGNRELLKDGENALLVRHDNAQDIEKSIRKVLTENTLSQRLVEGGRKTVTRFGTERMIRELVSVLSSV